MDTGLEELKVALRVITNWDGVSKLGYAAGRADAIGNTFNGVNDALANGWDQVEFFFNQIEEAVRLKMEKVYEVAQTYVQQSQENEEEEKSSVKSSNDAVQSILDDMGI